MRVHALMCACVGLCVCVCERDRERDVVKKSERNVPLSLEMLYLCPHQGFSTNVPCNYLHLFDADCKLRIFHHCRFSGQNISA